MSNDRSNDNPAEGLAGALPSGMKEEALVDAIVSSGYPLQVVVASEMAKRGFRVLEEWAYADPESGGRRAMDVVSEWQASANPHQTSSGSSTVRLALITECKQSRHPYVFFESVAPPTLDRFPLLSGLGTGTIELAPDFEWEGLPHMRWNSAPFKRQISVNSFLRIGKHPFIVTPPVVSSISKAAPVGKRIELSGSEPYNSLLIPLLKAVDVYREALFPYRSGGEYHDIRAVAPLAVIDAPLVISSRNSVVSPRSIDWVRVVVRKVFGDKPWWNPLDYEFVDVIHRDFLEEYLDRYVTPYITILWENHVRFHDVTLSGKAFVRGLSENGAVPEGVSEQLAGTG